MRHHLSTVTLCCIDTTPKACLGARAIEKTLEQSSFAEVKLLTNDMGLPHAVSIPEIKGLEGYSNFVVRELWKYINTKHVLICQWDGMALNGSAWDPRFLDWDYIGSPFNPSGAVGNGGWSLRSRRFLEAASRLVPNESAHPEDSFQCLKYRRSLELSGMKFAPFEVARRFGFEGRSWGGTEWRGMPVAWNGQYGMHSFLTVLPEGIDRPLIFSHSGDAGDVIYSLPVMAALGGGVMFLHGDNRYPYPAPTRWQRKGCPVDWVGNLASLLNVQPYVWACQFTHGLPHSTDVDFNEFRTAYAGKGPDRYASLFALHQKPFGVTWPEDKPWLVVDRPEFVEGRPIVVNRTERFHNDAFPWRALVEQYGEQMVFIGDPIEYVFFRQAHDPQLKVPHKKTGSLLEVARLIAGAKVFIGNQSCPLAIAHGLGKRVIVEEWLSNPNCHLNRPDAIYVRGNTTHVPVHWL